MGTDQLLDNLEDVTPTSIDKIPKGWRCAVEDRPKPETPVLALVNGIDFPIVLELRWETCNPMEESYFEDFLYWDDVHNDGQDFEGRVFAWVELPKH